MPTTATESLSDAARKFVESGPHKLLIGAEWVDAADGRTFETVDPSTGETICSAAQAGAEDVERAAHAARAALEGKWGKMPAAGRSLLINRLADLIEENSEELAQLEALDNGKPVTIAGAVDIPQAVAHLRYYAGWPTKIEGETIPVSWPNMFTYTLKEPVGVCGQIIPWNFPLLMASWKISPALAAGCTVILKPAEQTPLSAIRLGQLAQEAGFPEGVINVLTGDGSTGAALVDSTSIDKIAFTGSTEVGRRIGARCGELLKRVTLELGGKSPNIILPDADTDAAIKGSFQGIYFNTGQACNAGSRLFVQKDQFDTVVSGLAEAAKKAKVGPGLDTGTQFGPVVSKEQYERVSSYIESGLEQGAEAVAGGHGGGNGDGGYFINPTLLTGVTDDMKVAREEIFGPVLVAMPYDDLDEVARRANDTEYGLAAGVWTRDVANAHNLARKLKAGSIYINGWGMVDAAAPFGGYKASGIGREMGHANLDAYLEVKTVWTSLK
ncbi:MAG TPA: aldehyde dehydrogenase family protein [Thermoleophilaceae bacterium]